ncbi:MAG: 3-deoxy-7-phosphoheptulonate synthase [Clostridia bacterium]
MIIILKQNTDQASIEKLRLFMEEKGISIHLSQGVQTTIMGLIGDTTALDVNNLRALPFIEDVKRISEPYKSTNRKFHPADSLIPVGNQLVGAGNFHFMAGPCSIESEDQLTTIAKEIKKSGATFLRGGAFKPRSSPYAFQGLHGEGMRLLSIAKKETGLPIVTEIMNINHLDLFDDVDLIQVGARNMQNFELLKALGECNKPILLKRGLANTIEEWLMSAEYIMAGGNSNVILCERGIRTFETMTRNTLDLAAVPIIKRLSHLPIIVDPSHATGITWLIEPLAKASIAAGADGLMIEVHNNPAEALCDGAQSLTPAEFDHVMQTCKPYIKLEGRV